MNHETPLAQGPVDRHVMPQGFRLEWKAGEYCLYTPEDFAREVNTDTARIWGLFSAPQPGFSSEPAAYRGVFWCEAKYRKANAYMDPDAAPMYIGPVLHEPPMNADVLHLFPSLVENRLRELRPAQNEADGA